MALVEKDYMNPVLLSIAASTLMGLGCRAQAPPNFNQMLHRPAPDFELTALDGAKVKLSDYRGKVVLVTFWGHG